jgi:RimJ/RimL family protein N-acetyltransferase
MRRALRQCGYAKEAHYRQAWPAPDGTIYDAVGYAILRTDWRSGTVTMPEWDGE